MLLIIPSIEIINRKCAWKVKYINGFLGIDDPIEMAKLWRKENAKSLHVTDVDGAFEGYPVNFDIIKQIVKNVDIPVELGGGLRTVHDVEQAFENGIYRAVIGTMLVENPDQARRTIEKFGSNKIVLGIDTKNYQVAIKGGKEYSGLTPISFASSAKQLGFRRLLYTDVITDATTRKPNFEAIKSLAEKVQMRITVSGGISGLQDLLMLQELEPLGIDSVIIGRALYENKFSCQGLWRLCEAENYPYTARI